jgi:hypothetical protein
MSSKGRKAESVTDALTVPDIEAIVQKAVDAAAKIIRSEFSKMLDDFMQRLHKLEDRLSAIETGCQVNNVEQLERTPNRLGGSHPR